MSALAGAPTVRPSLAWHVPFPPSPVYAHAQIPGIADFWSGMLHPLSAPAHVLLLLGLGLLMGQHAPRGTAVSAVSFGAISAVGLGFTTSARVTGVDQPVLLVVAMCVAVLIVIARPLPPWAAAALFGAAGLLMGLDSVVENATLATAIKMSLGTWLCACLVVFNVAFYTSRLTRTWQKIGVRVAGSWILAVAMLVIAFALRR